MRVLLCACRGKRPFKERQAGEDVEPAILTVISQSGRVVVVSGCLCQRTCYEEGSRQHNC